LRRGGKGKEGDRKSTILKYISSVQVEDVMICIESCWDGREGVRKNTGRR
jgi:hypothetical protein